MSTALLADRPSCDFFLCSAACDSSLHFSIRIMQEIKGERDDILFVLSDKNGRLDGRGHYLAFGPLLFSGSMNEWTMIWVKSDGLLMYEHRRYVKAPKCHIYQLPLL